VDDFETLPKNKARNALAKVVVGTDLVSFDEEHLNEFNPACAPSRPSWFQDTNGLVLEWAAATANYTSNVGSLDVSAEGMVLSFRVGQDVTGNPPAASQKFKVTLTDALARSATLRVQDFATIPPPRTKNTIAGLMPPGCTPVAGSVTLCSLKTVRLPIARFKAANSALDTAAVASITFAFDTTPVGRLAIDDLEFSR